MSLNDFPFRRLLIVVLSDTLLQQSFPAGKPQSYETYTNGRIIAMAGWCKTVIYIK